MKLRLRPYWTRSQMREARVEAFKVTGSLYGDSYDELEERDIRAQLRHMGVPIDPVLTSAPEALAETYWEGDGADNYEARLRDYRVANDVRRPHIVHHPRRSKRQP